MKIELRPDSSPTLTKLTRSADQLEAAFLGEMLKIAMPNMSAGAFGGGVGESHFASFLTDGHAAAIAERIDLGLVAKMGLGNA